VHSLRDSSLRFILREATIASGDDKVIDTLEAIQLGDSEQPR
jgi:hypothetical protein